MSRYTRLVDDRQPDRERLARTHAIRAHAMIMIIITEMGETEYRGTKGGYDRG